MGESFTEIADLNLIITYEEVVFPSLTSLTFPLIMLKIILILIGFCVNKFPLAMHRS